MKQAAIGFRVHSGWAAVVEVCLEGDELRVLARQRVHLVETFTYQFRQPYHTAEKMPLEEARSFVKRVGSEAGRLAHRAIHAVQADLKEQGIQLTRCGLLLASGRPLPSFEKILASHALIHTADGELFREAISQACARCGVAAECTKDKELLQRAKTVLRVQPAVLLRRLAELGKPFGSPWSQDEKFATLAAWLALTSRNSDSNALQGKRSAAKN